LNTLSNSFDSLANSPLLELNYVIIRIVLSGTLFP
jgi:hypothetical protein